MTIHLIQTKDPLDASGWPDTTSDIFKGFQTLCGIPDTKWSTYDEFFSSTMHALSNAKRVDCTACETAYRLMRRRPDLT